MIKPIKYKPTCLFCNSPGEPVNLFIEENLGYRESWKIDLKKEINLCQQHLKSKLCFTFITKKELDKAA